MNLVMQLIIATSAVLLLPWSVRGVDGQQSSTRQNNATTDDPNVIELAGVFDITAYDWGPDVFEVAVQFINEGRWGNLLPPGTRVEYSLEDTDCDQTTAVRSYWKIRTENGDRPPHGVVGGRCSGATMSIGRFSGLEGVPHVSQAANSALLSDTKEYPFFSRLVPPNNGTGEVGALISMMHHFGWERVTTLATDLPFSQDMTNEFRRLWAGRVEGDWKGEVIYSDTIRTNAEGNVEMSSVRRALDNIPTDDPTKNSRIIFLAAHSRHAYRILEEAHTKGFQPDTIWVWGGREDISKPLDFSWLPDVPGFFGVGPMINRDEISQSFMRELQSYQNVEGHEVLTKLPQFAAETVDAVRVLVEAIGAAPDRRDGDAIVEYLRKLEFEGVSGHVEFTEQGDRKDAMFSIFNAQNASSEDKSITWTEVGTTGTSLGSVELNNGIEGVCFAVVGCGLDEAPEDKYPVDPITLPKWVLVLMIILGVLLLAALFKYWRSRRSKKSIKAELETLRESIVGMRAAECTYIPRVKKDIEQAIAPDKPTKEKTIRWMWQETPGYMENHDASDVYGSPEDCWVLYNPESTEKLEKAYQRGKQAVSPLDGYSVNLQKMAQIKLATGFERHVQRVVEGGESIDLLKEHDIDLSDVKVGDEIPGDLSGEPRMVLVGGDLVQISQQRDDGWAFGTKLHHADDATARELASLATKGMDQDEVNVLTDTGWFELDNTRIPTADELATLQKNLGDSGALNPPSHWENVADPSIAQKHALKKGDAERVPIENSFLSSLHPPRFDKGVEVLKVERIQNLAMWQSYVVKRQTICYRETGEIGNEDNMVQQKALARFERKWLFHGSNHEVVSKILQQGFNRSFCGKNATVYGKGVYFARDASYSAHPTYSVPDSKGRQYMVACRVVVGEYCRGRRDALTPDVRDQKSHSLYDTTVDDPRDPGIYVTYHDAQAYPEYLITFRTF